LGEHEIFVMGDNRNGSADSRREELGPIDIRTVAGRAVFGVTRGKLTVLKNPFGSD
jgi:signal peptidase I